MERKSFALFRNLEPGSDGKMRLIFLNSPFNTKELRIGIDYLSRFYWNSKPFWTSHETIALSLNHSIRTINKNGFLLKDLESDKEMKWKKEWRRQQQQQQQQLGSRGFKSSKDAIFSNLRTRTSLSSVTFGICIVGSSKIDLSPTSVDTLAFSWITFSDFRPNMISIFQINFLKNSKSLS